jgi:glycosyltransferase involved in cell wall biosynthesis
MRIINSVLGDASGGRWQVVCDYSRWLVDRGHRVLMLLGRRQATGLDSLPPGVDVQLVSAHGHYDFLAAWRLRRQLQGCPPDLAIAHCSRSVALLRRALDGRAPVLAVSHSNKVRRLLPADACLVLNQITRERLAQAGCAKPCFVVPNGISIDANRTPGPRQVHQPPRIGALGRFDRVKGFDVFIEALGILRDDGWQFQAVLGGSGSERQALATQAARRGLGGQLAFPGWIEDVERFYADLDILCVPARSDAFGLTPLQAARAGVAMVLSDVSGHREMFASDTEVLYAAVQDSRDTARQLARLMDDTALAARLRRAAFQKVLDCYSEPVVSEKIIYIIENLINNRIQ